MANFQTRDTKLHISKLPETSFNTFPTSASDYLAIISREPFWSLLSMEKIDDADAIGTGTEWATTQENGYWDHPPVNLVNNQALFDAYGRFWLRAAGGAVNSAAEGSGHKHICELQDTAAGRQLPSSTVIVKNGPMDLLLAGMVVSEISLSQARNARPELRVSLVGSGKHKNPHGISSMPAYVPPSILGGARGIVVKYTDKDSNVINLGASGCQFRDLNVTLNNNLKLQDQCPGDPSQIAGDPATSTGASAANYVSRILRQAPRSLVIGVTFLAQETLPEYIRYAENEEITNVTVAVQGQVIGEGPTRQELGVIFPKGFIRTIQAQDSEGDSAYSATFIPRYDSGIDNGAQFYVINDTSADYK